MGDILQVCADRHVGGSVRKLIYIGLLPQGQREILRCGDAPTAEAYPGYVGVIGPFRTVRGAAFMLQHGGNNPHCRTVFEAEKLAKGAA